MAVTVTPKELGRFGSVLDLEALICVAQMLLDGGLRKEQAAGYLRVGLSLGARFQDLLLAEGGDTEVHGILLDYQPLEQFSGNHDFALGSHRKGANNLGRLHPESDKATCPGPKSAARESQVVSRAGAWHRDPGRRKPGEGREPSRRARTPGRRGSAPQGLLCGARDAGTEAIPPREGRPGPRFPVPVVTIGTASNVTLAFALLPVWWALAVDQIVWFPLALFILGKSWIVERRFRVERTVLILLGPFAVSYLASGTSNVGVLGFVDGGVGKRAWAEAVTLEAVW